MTTHNNPYTEVITCSEWHKRGVARKLKTLRGIIMEDLPTKIYNDIHSSEFLEYLEDVLRKVEDGQYTTDELTIVNWKHKDNEDD
jgi:hypothetical protein